MARFGNAAKQADYIVNTATRFIKTRKKRPHSKGIKSAATKRNYRSPLKQASAWLKQNGQFQGLDKMTYELAESYLHTRKGKVRQKTLDMDRQALELLPLLNGKKLPIIKSQLPDGKLGKQSRAYSAEQIALIKSIQSEKFQLSTELSDAAGLRSFELLTIRPASDQPRTGNRPWSKKRFSGMSGSLYTVLGKGGLIREVMIPYHLSEKLEKHRRAKPIIKTNRKINYVSMYDIPSGQNWSQNFSQASQRYFGWSHGAHGLRHGFAQRRMNKLQSMGFSYNNALLIVSQEMGHFRPDITEIYLR